MPGKKTGLQMFFPTQTLPFPTQLHQHHNRKICPRTTLHRKKYAFKGFVIILMQKALLIATITFFALLKYQKLLAGFQMCLACQKSYVLLRLAQQRIKYAKLRNGQNFILKKDNDFGHGKSKSNIVRTWKKKHNFRHYFNCTHSLNIPFIEKAWQAFKAAIRKLAI
ncbi:hypothetical protein GGTG_01525 [Gaeumannomyces tritici R3-111a-1]|uniref:Uncharacterized protein n=1 Tax=Gaeumannomyces tritici (strain R3-111a-1) TaxID=644352 RepID=J3NJU4_GAET3|nr:hypothetical protein GGTG_01525 [Gaeumannomyces tritici R3-111a-1]EJT81547.1 hypothetical protein GGTG_01525 [Gaeumannomyces tritici R3-111a-1]